MFEYIFILFPTLVHWIKVQCFIWDGPLLAMNGVTTRIRGVTILRKKVVGDHFCRVFVDLLTSKKDCTNFFIGIMSHLPMPNHWILPFGCFVFFWCLLLQILILFVGRDESSPFLWIWISVWMQGNQKMTKFIFAIVRANIALVVFRGVYHSPSQLPTTKPPQPVEVFSKSTSWRQYPTFGRATCFTPMADSNLGLVGGRCELRGGINLHGLSNVQGF